MFREVKSLDELTWQERVWLPKKSVVHSVVLLAVLVVVNVVVFWGVGQVEGTSVGALFLVPVVGAAFVLQTADSAAGMGFGTALAPLLLVMGYDPLAVVPSLLISQALAGLAAGYMHHEVRNARFSLRRPWSTATAVMLLLTVVGLGGSLLAILLGYVAFAMPAVTVKVYVSVLVIVMGVVGLVRYFVPASSTLRLKRLVGFALLAGVNKGIAGGGYGPVVTLGQIFSGVHEKSAAASTTMSEGVVSTFAALVYVGLWLSGAAVSLLLLPATLAGATLASLLSPYLVRVLPRKLLAVLIPLYSMGLGFFALWYLM